MGHLVKTPGRLPHGDRPAGSQQWTVLKVCPETLLCTAVLAGGVRRVSGRSRVFSGSDFTRIREQTGMGASCRRDRSQPFGDTVPTGKPDPLRSRRHASAVHSSFLPHFSQLKHLAGTSIHSHGKPSHLPIPFPFPKPIFITLEKGF